MRNKTNKRKDNTGETKQCAIDNMHCDITFTVERVTKGLIGNYDWGKCTAS